ncbi:MAG: zf-HC2 domain-containing protein [Candidatus Nanopelagicales bacterium]
MTGRCLGDRVADLADGRMTPAEAERAFAHVAACPACRAALDAQRSASAALDSAPAPAPSSDFLARLSAIPAMAEPPAPPVPAAAIPAQSGPAAGVRPAGAAGVRPSTSRRPRRKVVVATAAGAAVLAVAAAVGSTSAGLGTVTPPRPSFAPVVDTFSIEHSVSVDTMPLSGPHYETAAFGSAPSPAATPSTAP